MRERKRERESHKSNNIKKVNQSTENTNIHIVGPCTTTCKEPT